MLEEHRQLIVEVQEIAAETWWAGSGNAVPSNWLRLILSKQVLRLCLCEGFDFQQQAGDGVLIGLFSPAAS